MENSKNFFEELKQYFKENDKKTILKDWEATEKFDEIGPSAKEFITHSNLYHKVSLEDPIDLGLNFKSNYTDPEFTSGFLLNNNLNYQKKTITLKQIQQHHLWFIIVNFVRWEK
jgi:hypothetical protein